MKQAIRNMLLTAVCVLLLATPFSAAGDPPRDWGPETPTLERRPYGDYPSKHHGRYGASRLVETEAAARRILVEYYSGQDVQIGALERRRWFFRAEILDSSGTLLDTVIIDRRTGRIRSIQ